jgi:hypothetical protein
MIKAIYNKPVARKILNTQSNPEQREQWWKYHATKF